jgi:hypothetical protein
MPAAARRDLLSGDRAEGLFNDASSHFHARISRMNLKTILGIAISVGLLASLASASGGGTPQGDPPKPGPSASSAPKEKPKAPKPEPKKPSEGGW